jgi:hypothetical protein
MPLNEDPRVFEFTVKSEQACAEAALEVEIGLDSEKDLYEGYTILCEAR